MAFFSKVGNILRQTASKQINSELSASNPSIYQVIRCMSSSKLFIGGLSYSTDDQSLRESFSHYGEVVEARVIMDRETGRSRGFGFITFTSSEEASSAIQALDGQDLHGRQVRVNYATDRRASMGGGYGGGGYGGGGYGGGNYGGGGGGYNAGGMYGGGGGGGDGYGTGGSSFSGGYGSGSGGGNYGGSGGGGFASGNSYDGGNGGNYGGSGNFGVASGGDNHVSGGAVGGGSFTSGGYDGNTGPGYSGGDQFGNNEISGTGDAKQGDPLEGNFRDDDDEPDYAKRA